MNDLIKLTGVWKNTDKNGNEYFSGGMSVFTKILIMKNTFKEGEKDPDFYVYLAKKDKKEGAKTDGNDIPF